MTPQKLQETVHTLVGNAKTEEAIKRIIRGTHEQEQEELKRAAKTLKKDLAILSGNKNVGLLSPLEANLEQERINNAILGLCEGDKDARLDAIKNNTIPEKMKILMLTANPAKTTKLNLDKEHSDILQKLQEKQAYFEISRKKAVNTDEFREWTQKAKPHILHFSGHGTRTGIVVQNDDKNGYEVIPTHGVKALFEYLQRKQPKIRMVLLNACHSETQALAISEQVEYVIGTSVSIKDNHAHAFSSGFYFQLAEDKADIKEAFASGRTAAMMKGAEKAHFMIYEGGKLITI